VSKTDRDKWDARYRADGATVDPSPFLLELDGLMPRKGRALDVAGGAGRNALWLVTRGLDVTLCDISSVALAIARERAAKTGGPLTVQALDLEADRLPAGPWDLIVCMYFLLRPLFAQFPGVLAPGGWLVFAHPTRKNLERHARPPAAYLLEEGEARTLVRGLEVVRYDEGWTDEGRHEARLVARRSPGDVSRGSGR
jgi:SAM-dependent methyltransferase